MLKYSFTSVTGAASTVVSEHTRNQFPLWQLGFMYIHTTGGTQTTPEVFLLYLIKTKQNNLKKLKHKKRIYILRESRQ